MIKYIHEETLKNHISASGKAIYFTVRRGGTTARHDEIIWLPLSQLKIGELNECGWAKIEIPYWLIKKNSLEKAGFVELQNE